MGGELDLLGGLDLPHRTLCGPSLTLWVELSICQSPDITMKPGDPFSLLLFHIKTRQVKANCMWCFEASTISWSLALQSTIHESFQGFARCLQTLYWTSFPIPNRAGSANQLISLKNANQMKFSSILCVCVCI